ncbi:hypothetical protein [Mangrovibacterium marinum]|uniref:hypothetical protein n=1 Tax=Mangrovibacterium marinum TaxID=1639118 RepID=UPI002A18B0E7|nr:hypothetical protein [Mangrovibacterium marinum]
MRLKKPILTALFIFLCLFARAQQEKGQNELLQLPLSLLAANPEHPIGIFALDLPFYFPGTSTNGSQLAVSYTLANIWHPQAWFYYPQNLTAAQKSLNKDLYMTWRPTYFQTIGAQTQVKTFQSDGVLQHFRFSWIRNWKQTSSLILTMNAHLLSGGSSPLHYPVSDSFIEDFHSTFAIDDNYGRRQYPFNRASILFADENGNQYRKDKGDWFTSVFDAHYYRELFRQSSALWSAQLTAGVHLSVPFNSLHRYLIPGVSLGLRYDRLMTARSSATFAMDGALTNPTFLKTGKSVEAIDNSFRSALKFYLGLNRTVGKQSLLQLGLLSNIQGALLKGGTNKWGQLGYDEIGVEYLQKGDQWEGEEVNQEFWLARITPAALYYFSYKAFFVVGWKHRARQFNFYLGEDFFYINNAPDFQLGFEYLIPLSHKK